jgi:NADP-dependent 3-hydroxy acid dehydrogenase YdfG
MTLAGKTALITGASAGIGYAIAHELAAAGAFIVITGRRKEKLDAAFTRLTAQGAQGLAIPADAAQNADTDALLDQTLKLTGRLDIVIVNAGRGLAGGLLASDQAQWQALYNINVLGPAHLMRRAAQHMTAQKTGDIVVLGSVSGHNISPYSGFYGSTKFAIWGLAEALRREICSTGVRVTTIKPAVVLSEFQQVAGYTEENFGHAVKKFGQLLEPEDVARSVRFIVEQPPHVHINELMIRGVGQDYP